MTKPKGWRKEPARHALAAKGVRIGKGGESRAKFARTLDVNPFDAFWRHSPKENYDKRHNYFGFSGVTPKEAEMWMATHPAVLDPGDAQNMSPTNAEMIEIAKKHRGTLFGYAIPPESGRSDARVSFEGFILPISELQALRLQNDLRADEFDKVRGGYRYWWD